ncbi:type VII secretion integral membrane protein EccD [Actinoplanes rectilineatus]|uniref:type VII secretion integral membrane protein EccD n=1 Tax=Actinoplanes rectilineatus TaxID=113571 RepID=UPI0005F29754|nr:type VII secretion integral membrane protein EccD [Actinoplanes rectilineatus]
MNAGLARVTVRAAQHRADVALPDHAPLAELLPDLLHELGADLADEGEKHGGWVLRRADGVALATGHPLQAQGVRDGDVLHLVPADADWPEPDHDDPAEAVADGARRLGGIWTPSATRTTTIIAAALPLALGLGTLTTAGPRESAGAVGLGLATLLALIATITSRVYAQSTVAVALGGSALPYAFAGAALLVSASDPPGAPVAFPWLGGAELLAGAVATVFAAAAAGLGVGAGIRLFTAGATAGLLGVVGALTDPVTTVSGGAAVLLAVLTCGIVASPRLAVQSARLGPLLDPSPGPDFSDFPDLPDPPAGIADERLAEVRAARAARSRLDHAAVLAAVARADDLLAGMLAGHALVAAAAFTVLAAAATPATRVMIGLGAAGLLLRARLFAAVRHRVPLLAGGLAGLAALTAGLAELLTALPVLPAAGALTTVALGIVAIGVTRAGRPAPAHLSRTADVLDALVMITIIPAACAVTGVYAAVSGL